MTPVTVVTGGSRGIGAAISERLAADGHAVCIAYHTDQAAAGATVERIRSAGGQVVAVQADTCSESDVERLFDVAASLGAVTGLVNNAATTGPFGRLADTAPDMLRRVVQTNVVGYLLCARRAIIAMAGRGGSIVNISSAAATTGSPGEYVHYAATKGAVDTMTVGLSKEVGPDGIRVNAVSPGVIVTGLHAAWGDPDRAARVGRQSPAGRPGRPQEIAAAVAWLLSAEASYTSGAILRVAGGR